MHKHMLFLILLRKNMYYVHIVLYTDFLLNIQIEGT